MSYLITLNDRIDEIKKKAVYGTFLLLAQVKPKGEQQSLISRDDWRKAYLWIDENNLIDFYGGKIVSLDEINAPNIFVGGFVFSENKKDFIEKISGLIKINFWNKLFNKTDKKLLKEINADNFKLLVLTLAKKENLEDLKLLAFIHKNAKRIF